MDMPTVPIDFDQVAIVVDWLDACRKHDIDALLELYSQDAKAVCGCDAAEVSEGRAALEKYWRSRLDALSPDAFGLEEIAPSADGVVLDYLSYEGKPVRMVFTFDTAGKILQTHCAPLAAASAQDIVGLQHRLDDEAISAPDSSALSGRAMRLTRRPANSSGHRFGRSPA